MKLFLEKISLFFLFLLGYFCLMYVINILIINSRDLEWKSSSLLIAGDSHTKRGINPVFFSSATNISQTAEPYYITFWKLQKYFSKYETDTILLGFSYHNLSSFNDKKLSDEFWSNEMFERIYTLGKMSSLQQVPKNMKGFYKVKFKNMCLFPNLEPFKFIGGYSNNYSTDLSKTSEVIKRHYYDHDSVAEVSIVSLKYLDSIVMLCERKNVTLVPIALPMHRRYLRRIPSRFINRFEKEKIELNERGIDVLDLSKKQYNDSFFLNSDHLNADGAYKVTKEIISFFHK